MYGHEWILSRLPHKHIFAFGSLPSVDGDCEGTHRAKIPALSTSKNTAALDDPPSWKIKVPPNRILYSLLPSQFPKTRPDVKLGSGAKMFLGND